MICDRFDIACININFKKFSYSPNLSNIFLFLVQCCELLPNNVVTLLLNDEATEF